MDKQNSKNSSGECIEIHWASGSLDEARKVCRYLVQEKWVACAQITPWIESIYLWNNQLETQQESKVVLKTRREHFQEIEKIIKQNSAYQLPEITAVTIEMASEDYLAWVLETTAAANLSR